MPPLSDEEKERLRTKIEEIKLIHQGDCAYPYTQGVELRKTSKYKKSEGVCFAMSLDWLRRRMWNVYNVGAKAKRNFNDVKYANSNKKQVALTTKHGKLQDAYAARSKEQKHASVQSILGKMVEVGVVSAGMDRLKSTQLVHIYEYEMSESAWASSANGIMRMGTPNAQAKFKLKFGEVLASARQRIHPVNAPSVGILMEMQGEHGHAVALFVSTNQDVFFDPNFGEYVFGPAGNFAREINFVANLWFDVYHKFYQMDTLTFSAIEYQPAPVVV